MRRIRPLMDEGALSTGPGRRQLLTEMRRLTEALGLEAGRHGPPCGT